MRRGASSTITQVAKRAGVSPSTVSYVLSGNRSISEETRNRVKQAIEELHYTPHAGARALRAGKTNVVALVVPFSDWTTETVLMPFVYGVVDEARGYNWNIMLVTGGRGDAEIDEVLGSKMVDGVVMMEVRVDDERLKIIEELALPAVCMGVPPGRARVPYVDLDFEKAGRLCAEHLVNFGHRKIGFLASSPSTFQKKMAYAHNLWRGVTTTLAEAGLRFHGLPMEPTVQGAHRALDRLFEEEPGLTALIVHNESMIGSFMPVLHQRGKEVPSQLSVVTLAWAELVKHISPSLTYVNVPAVELGRAAIALLAGGGRSHLLAPTLTAGSSVAPPPPSRARRARPQRN